MKKALARQEHFADVLRELKYMEEREADKQASSADGLWIETHPQSETERGDMWFFPGKHGQWHVLMCGDNRAEQDINELVLSHVPFIDLLNTDPPYGVNWRSDTMNARYGGKPQSSNELPLAGDHQRPEQFASDLRLWFKSAAHVLKPGGCFYVWGVAANLASYPQPLEEAGLGWRQTIVWDKRRRVRRRGRTLDYMEAVEVCFYGWREGGKHVFFGRDNASTLWRYRGVRRRDRNHPTPKPVALAARAISHASRPGEAVLDMFAGSGSTLFAIEKCETAAGRTAYLMEIEPKHCDGIVARWRADPEIEGEAFKVSRAEREEEWAALAAFAETSRR